MLKQDRDNFHNMKEVRSACYKARLVIQRKRVTVEEMRDAALLLNKVVRTLNSWRSNQNYYKRTKAEDMAWKRLNSLNRDGPLIPLSYNE